MLLPLLFSAAGIILWGFAFLYIRSYLKRHTGSELLRKWQDEAGRLISEIDAATDRDSALVEDRIKTLRALLEDVDRRIAVYVREAGRQKNQEAAYAELGRRRRPSGSLSAALPPAEELPAGLPAAPKPPDAGEASPSPAPPGTGGRALPPELPRIVHPPQPVEPKPPSFSEQVAKLVGAGFSPELIASRLGVTIGEAELAVALFQRKQGDRGNVSR